MGKAEDVDLGRRRFMQQGAAIAAGAAVDPTILAEGAAEVVPAAAEAVRKPAITTVYKFAESILVDDQIKEEGYEGEIVYDIVYDSSQPNQLEVNKTIGQDDVETYIIDDIMGEEALEPGERVSLDMQDVDKIVSDMILEGVDPTGAETEWNTKNIHSVQAPERDPFGEEGNNANPMTAEEKEGYKDADLDYLKNIGGEVSTIGPVDPVGAKGPRLDLEAAPEVTRDKATGKIRAVSERKMKPAKTKPGVDVAATLLDTAIKEKAKEITEEPKTREEQRKEKLAAEKEQKALPPPKSGARTADFGDTYPVESEWEALDSDVLVGPPENWTEHKIKKHINTLDPFIFRNIDQRAKKLWNRFIGSKIEEALIKHESTVRRKSWFDVLLTRNTSRTDKRFGKWPKASWDKGKRFNPLQVLDIIEAITGDNDLNTNEEIAEYLNKKWGYDTETRTWDRNDTITLDDLKNLPFEGWPKYNEKLPYSETGFWDVENNTISFRHVRKSASEQSVGHWRKRIEMLPKGRELLAAKRKKLREKVRAKTSLSALETQKRRKENEEIAKTINTPAFYMWLIKALINNESIPSEYKHIISKRSLYKTKRILNDPNLPFARKQEKIAGIVGFSKEAQDKAWKDMEELTKLLTKRTGIQWSRDHIIPILVNENLPGGIHSFPFFMPIPESINSRLSKKNIKWENGIPKEPGKSNYTEIYFTELYDAIEKSDKNDKAAFINASIKAMNAVIAEGESKGERALTHRITGEKAETLSEEEQKLEYEKADIIGKKGAELRIAIYKREQTSEDIKNIVNSLENSLDGKFVGETKSETRTGARAVEPTLEPEVKKYKTSMGAHQRWWQIAASFMWSKPVEAIRRYRYASPTMAKLADMIQRDPSETKRVIKGGLDYIQRKGMAMGQFRVALQATLDELTSRMGVIPKHVNDAVIMYLVQNKPITNPKVAKQAERLKQILESIYVWSQEHGSKVTSDFSLRPLDGGLLPRVWNVEELATPEGRAKFMELLKKIGIEDNPEAESEFERYAATNAYNIAVNSGGFISGDFTTTAYNQKSKKARQFQVELFEKIEKEISRGELGTLLVNDLQALLPRFVDKAVEKTLYAELFGHYDEKLWEMKEQIEKEIADYNRDNPGRPVNLNRAMRDINDMMAILRHRYKMDSSFFGARRFIQWFMNFTTVTMMPMVALASLPEFFTPLALGSKNPIGFFNDFRMAGVYAGMRAMNGMNKLFFGKQMDAMKYPKGKTARRAMFLKALGIIDIRTMGEAAAMRYIGPSFIRTGIGTANVGSRKFVKALYKLYGLGEPATGRFRARSARAVTNMDTYFELTFLTTMTQMQQMMAANNFRRYVLSHLKSLSKGKRTTVLDSTLEQQRQELRDFGFTDEEIAEAIRWYEAGHREFYDIPAEFKFDAAGATLRFVDQVITRPNEATAAKAFSHPAMAPLLLFKSFMTTYANTYMVAIRDRVRFAQGTGGQKHYQQAKMVAGLGATFAAMYGMVLFAQAVRQMIQFGDDDDDNYMAEVPAWKKFISNVNRTGLLTAPGSMLADIWLPYKYGWWQSPAKRTADTIFGPGVRQGATILDLVGDLANKGEVDIERFLGQLIPATKYEAFRNVTGTPSYYERDDSKGKYKL